MIAIIFAKYLCFEVLEIESIITIELVILKEYNDKVDQKYFK